jgi:hypothetical protein
MNEHDRNNLKFILHTDEEKFDEWLQTASNEDVDYALELIRIAKSELLVQEAEFYDAVVDLSEANRIIDVIRNLGKF